MATASKSGIKGNLAAGLEFVVCYRPGPEPVGAHRVHIGWVPKAGSSPQTLEAIEAAPGGPAQKRSGLAPQAHTHERLVVFASLPEGATGQLSVEQADIERYSRKIRNTVRWRFPLHEEGALRDTLTDAIDDFVFDL